MGFLGAETQDVSSGSTAFTVPSGCTFLLVKLAHTTGSAPSTVTLGGTALTFVAGADNTDALYAGIYRRSSPAIGSITLAHNSGAAASHATFEYYDGIDLGGPVRNSATEGGNFTTSFSMDVTSASGDLCSDIIVVQANGTATQGGSQTLVVSTTYGTTFMYGASRRTASGATTTFDWTTSASQRQAHVAVSLIPSSGSTVAKSVFPFFLG